MRIRLITIAHKAPAWINEGFFEYAKRLPQAFAIELIEIPVEKRTPNTDVTRLLKREGEKMLSTIKDHHRVIALDVKGKMFNTEEFAKQLTIWHQEGLPIDFLIGGPDGLATTCLQRANFSWSLSSLTFPHLLVRILVAEQLYRAFTIQTDHPYHR